MKYMMILILMGYLLAGCGSGGPSDASSNRFADNQGVILNSFDKGDSNSTSANLDTNSSDANTSVDREISEGEIGMQQNRPYVVYPGDRVEKRSDDAKVTITHIDGHKESTVVLIAGEAVLVRK